VVARADETETAVNALSHRHFDEAMTKARKAQARYAKKNARIGRLEGLPLAVKEDTAIKGKPQTAGSLIFKDNIATHNSPSIERLPAAGAIVHAANNLPGVRLAVDVHVALARNNPQPLEHCVHIRCLIEWLRRGVGIWVNNSRHWNGQRRVDSDAREYVRRCWL
jgi:hypothetical protein